MTFSVAAIGDTPSTLGLTPAQPGCRLSAHAVLLLLLRYCLHLTRHSTERIPHCLLLEWRVRVEAVAAAAAEQQRVADKTADRRGRSEAKSWKVCSHSQQLCGREGMV
ncbi:hypothetical protein GWK47_053380 [Chionoecetes opilio]|uniref:Uncharacterized protein n=1 Tax=Chionoecetes opilio TaxID=41210 RepID=A0A8J4Y739_CHIOP|nr:hypothetical protein GWK47_053380 [Chionoecetes opilio]